MQLRSFQLECMMKFIHDNVSLDIVIHSINMYSLYCLFEPIEMHDFAYGLDRMNHLMDDMGMRNQCISFHYRYTARIAHC